MKATPALYTMGICLLAGTMTVGATRSASWFEARTTGAKALTLSGAAQFGRVAGDGEASAFVITLGAESPTGAVLFTRYGGERPTPGVYRLGEDTAAVHAMVVTGAPARPTGAFRAITGRLTVTHSVGDVIAGHFELDAVGYDATEATEEERPLSAEGTFTATAGR
jgi:hypothetical protein